MGRNRKRKGSQLADDSISLRKRSRAESLDHSNNVQTYYDQKPRADPTTGLKSAFPGLEDDDDQLFYGPASDGLEYLRMVR